MGKKPICDASQEGSKGHIWINFFWLVENYCHFSHPKDGKAVTGLEIAKFREDEKCCIQKCNQCVSHMTPIWSIHNPSHNVSWDLYVTTFDPYVTYLQLICKVTRDPYMIHQ